MKKQLHKLAGELQSLLLRHAQGEGLSTAPRVILDAWAALYCWHQAGERCIRLTDEQESALLDHPLPPDLPLLTAPSRHGESIALQMPERSIYIVLARIPARGIIQVHGEHVLSYNQPVIVYCHPGPPLGSGYINLLDQPTPAHLHLAPGTLHRRDGKHTALTDAEITPDDYLLSIALAAFFAP